MESNGEYLLICQLRSCVMLSDFKNLDRPFPLKTGNFFGRKS